jgi:predicted Zn-dependent protease
VTLRRIPALLALALGAWTAAACTPAGAPSQTTAAPRTPTVSPEIERFIGGQVYQDPALYAYVDRVGQRLVDKGDVAGSGYRFYVLDLPTPNAHALSTGQVFVTRGLLAILDDEAELAAAMAHELGHLARRHAAQREQQRQGVLQAILEATRITGSTVVATSVAQEGVLALRRYSREQELDADRAGLGYLQRAGYRSDAILTLIGKLRRQARLEATMAGVAPEASERRSVLATHPGPEERLVALRAQPMPAGGDTGRAPFLAAIDGMPVDDPPSEGYVRGTAFLHPEMKLAFEAPRGFRLRNTSTGVWADGGIERGLMYFTCRRERIDGKLTDWMRNEIKPTPADVQETEIGGAEAAISERPRGSDTGSTYIRQVFIRRAEGACIFTLAVDSAGDGRRMEALIAAARTFRTLSDQEAASLRPRRLRVVPAGSASVTDLAARMPYTDLRLERLLALNGVDSAAELASKGSVKIVEP